MGWGSEFYSLSDLNIHLHFYFVSFSFSTRMLSLKVPCFPWILVQVHHFPDFPSTSLAPSLLIMLSSFSSSFRGQSVLENIWCRQLQLNHRIYFDRPDWNLFRTAGFSKYLFVIRYKSNCHLRNINKMYGFICSMKISRKCTNFHKGKCFTIHVLYA